MKRTLYSVVLFFTTLSLPAQNVSLDKAVNTLKERISLSGYAQTGYTYDDSDDKSNSFEVKRIIFMAHGQITHNWSCYFMYNFKSGGSLLEVYTEYKLLPQLTLRAGQFKTMFSLENPLSPTVEELINCNSQAVAYLAGSNGSDPLYGSNSGRDTGLLIYGDCFNKYLHYDFAVMNGQGINVNDKNNRKDLVGRIIVNPLKWLSVSGSFINGKGCAIALSDANPELKIGDNYTRNRWAAGALIKTKPVDLRTEYLEGKDGHVKSGGYYMTACAHILPKFDFIASYDYFNKNKDTDYKQTNYVAGVQYWFYPRCRVQAQYTHCNCHIGEDKNLLQAQLQVRF
ncbi:MAG: OprO/OprP family phosphate-selective porin [Bacteroides sp.]|jgi:hypothetical protein|nr:OprO/OprP family phosphate-selective porin [Bacteroides sp.]